jgi:hypothetical protein
VSQLVVFFDIDLIHGLLYLLAIVLPFRYARIAFDLGLGMCLLRFLVFGLSPEFLFPLVLYVPLSMVLAGTRVIRGARNRAGNAQRRRANRRHERYELLRDLFDGGAGNDHNPRNQNGQHNAGGREPEYDVPQAHGRNHLWPPEAGPGEGQFQNEDR